MTESNLQKRCEHSMVKLINPTYYYPFFGVAKCNCGKELIASPDEYKMEEGGVHLTRIKKY